MNSLRVAQVMTRDVFAVGPDTSVVSAARLLVNRHITGAPVIDVLGRVVGVVTLADLADPDREHSDRLGTSVFYFHTRHHVQVARGEVPVTSEGVVSDVMSPFVLAIGARAPLLDAVRLMTAEDVHRLLVLEDGKLAGMITTTDVMRALVEREKARDGTEKKEAAAR
jgi:CBS-domain-containing membrane protein